MFYIAFKKQLAAARPLPKLLVIKAVVFFSFYQSIAISFMVYYGWIKDDPASDPEWAYSKAGDKATALQDFIICVEMFGYALVHHYVFSYREYMMEGQDTSDLTFKEALLHLFTVKDVADDVLGTLQVFRTSA